MSGVSLIISSANRNENERFMAHKKKVQTTGIKPKSLSVSFHTHDLQTLAHVGEKLIKWLSVAKYEQNKYSY